jgi:hypothetical protein
MWPFQQPWQLGDVGRECLRPAVAATGYELRTVTRRAGLVDAVIEDEIPRCRFLIADLSDDNAGAYWEADRGSGQAGTICVQRKSPGEGEKHAL